MYTILLLVIFFISLFSGASAFEIRLRPAVGVVAAGGVAAAVAHEGYIYWTQPEHQYCSYRLVFRTLSPDFFKRRGPPTDLIVVPGQPESADEDGSCALGQGTPLCLVVALLALGRRRSKSPNGSSSSSSSANVVYKNHVYDSCNINSIRISSDNGKGNDNGDCGVGSGNSDACDVENDVDANSNANSTNTGYGDASCNTVGKNISSSNGSGGEGTDGSNADNMSACDNACFKGDININSSNSYNSSNIPGVCNAGRDTNATGITDSTKTGCEDASCDDDNSNSSSSDTGCNNAGSNSRGNEKPHCDNTDSTGGCSNGNDSSNSSSYGHENSGDVAHNKNIGCDISGNGNTGVGCNDGGNSSSSGGSSGNCNGNIIKVSLECGANASMPRICVADKAVPTKRAPVTATLMDGASRPNHGLESSHRLSTFQFLPRNRDRVCTGMRGVESYSDMFQFSTFDDEQLELSLPAEPLDDYDDYDDYDIVSIQSEYSERAIDTLKRKAKEVRRKASMAFREPADARLSAVPDMYQDSLAAGSHTSLLGGKGKRKTLAKKVSRIFNKR